MDKCSRREAGQGARHVDDIRLQRVWADNLPAGKKLIELRKHQTMVGGRDSGGQREN